MIELLKNLCDNEELIEVGRKAVEDLLVELRDSHISLLNRGNGLVIRNPDGTRSDHIRLGMEQALITSFKAMITHLENQDS